MTINTRIKEALRSRFIHGNGKVNISAAAEALEVSRQAIIFWLKDATEIKDKNLRKIEEVTGHSKDWIVTGIEPKLIVRYEKDAGHHNKTSFMVKDESEAMNVYTGPETKGLVPVVSWVKAGSWAEAEDPFEPGEADEFMLCPVNHGMHTFALRVQGDSMTSPHGKSYPAGCVIYVDPDQRGGVVSGDKVIAKLRGENAVTFKVFIEDAGKRFLKPLNTQYPPIIDEFRILGKIIGKWEDE